MSECKDAPRKELISEINQCHLEQEKYEKELLELQAQVAVLRGALERARKGFVNLIDLNLLPSEEYEKDANKIAQCCFEALSDTPTEAAERVQKLVEVEQAAREYVSVSNLKMSMWIGSSDSLQEEKFNKLVALSKALDAIEAEA